jgi:hypothetical protein
MNQKDLKNLQFGQKRNIFNVAAKEDMVDKEISAIKKKANTLL